MATHVVGEAGLRAGTVLVWATSYQQPSLPGRLNPKRTPYVALPDAYLKYANWGTISAIPAIYQPYYAPTGGTTHWTVNVASADGTRSVANVLITDVGPWNEDDNWWDANGTSATLPASCPVSTNLIAPDATSNALVDGICPNGQNLRRIYYYLLYQHDGLPFFHSAGYAPSGTFQDGTAWPVRPARASRMTLLGYWSTRLLGYQRTGARPVKGRNCMRSSAPPPCALLPTLPAHVVLAPPGTRSSPRRLL